VKIKCTQFRVIAVTDPHRPPVANPQTGPITIHCAAKRGAQRKYLVVIEIWATSDVSDSELGLDGFVLCRKDPGFLGH